ncbi:MAG: O-antigen ligase family protein [Bryobacterales bacterium]|nr:O-antigen ligase family protein [Bryobacterales bacterium]
MLGLGYIVTLLDVYLRYSRIHDLFIPPEVRISAIIVLFGVLALLATGRILSPLTSKVGRYILFATFWMMLSVGVSVWPGGAYSYFVEHWIKSIITFFFVVAFIRTFTKMRTIVLTVAAGCLTAAVLAFFMGVDMAGRSSVDLSYGNPNDLAFLILFGMPLSLWVVFDKRAPNWQRLGFLGGVMIALPVLAKTGSRAALLIIMVLSLYTFWRVSAKNRVRLLLAGAVLAPLAVVAIPRDLIVRYSTLFTAQANVDPLQGDAEEADEATSATAAQSANMRVDLLKRSLAVTLENPLLGVGPGMFVVAENDLAVAAGRARGYWKGSHNMYTQISSETGMVGFALLAMILVWSWKVFTRVERSNPRLFPFSREMRTLALALKASILVYLVAGFTLSIAYGPFMPVLAGLAVSLSQLLGAAEADRRRRAIQAEEDEPDEAATVVAPRPQGELVPAARSHAGQPVASRS